MACILLVLDAPRRTIGCILPAVAARALAFAFQGDVFLGHRGYDLDRMAGEKYVSMAGIWGTPVAVTGFLQGTVSGSGVAPTVTPGSLVWPMLRAGRIQPGIGRGGTLGRRDRRDPVTPTLGSSLCADLARTTGV